MIALRNPGQQHPCLIPKIPLGMPVSKIEQGDNGMVVVTTPVRFVLVNERLVVWFDGPFNPTETDQAT